jgi:hypothetical protein
MKIEMNERMIANLRVFLDRADLKGGDVPAFVEIQNAINMARSEESTINEDVNCKKVV